MINGMLPEPIPYEMFQRNVRRENNEMVFKKFEPAEAVFEKEGDNVEGVLVAIKSKVGPNESLLYSIETKEGVKNVWGSAYLDSRLPLIKIGTKVRITFKGISKEKTSGGKKPAKMFDVEVDED